MGVLAGVATVATSGLMIVLVDLLSSKTLRGTFSTGGRADPHLVRLARDILAPWNRQYSEAFVRAGVRQTSQSSGLVFAAVLVLCAVLALVGRQVRVHAPASLRVRLLVLTAASLTSAGAVSLVAALDSYSVALRHYSHDPLTYFSSALLLTFVIGAFAFGVVDLLPASLPAALRRAGLLLAVSFALAALVLPLFAVVNATRPGSMGAHFAQASDFSAAAGGLAVPFALQAPVSVDELLATPFLVAGDFPTAGSSVSSGNVNRAFDFHVRWMSVVYAFCGDTPVGLYRVAAHVGSIGTVVGTAVTITVLGALGAATLSLCRRVRPRGAHAALRLGLLQGGAIVLLLVPLALLSAYTIRYVTPEGTLRSVWGSPALALLWTSGVVLGVCTASALVWAAVAQRRSRRDVANAAELVAPEVP